MVRKIMLSTVYLSVLVFIVVQCSGYKRNLAEETDASLCVVSGDGISSVEAFTNYTVYVTTKDSTGTDRNVGGDIFFIRIENQCNSTTGMFECQDVTNQDQVLQTEIETQMYDSLNGTYYYTYSTQLNGTITITVILYTQYGIYGEYFNNLLYSGTVYGSQTLTQMSFSTTGDLITGLSNSLTANFFMKVKAPETDNYTLTYTVDDSATMYVNGVQTANGTVVSWDQNQFYSI